MSPRRPSLRQCSTTGCDAWHYVLHVAEDDPQRVPPCDLCERPSCYLILSAVVLCGVHFRALVRDAQRWLESEVAP
jgi:hypothetical protein